MPVFTLINQSLDLRKCSKCKQIKSLSDFFRDNNRKSGFYPNCRQCESERKKKIYDSTKSVVNVSEKVCLTCLEIKAAEEFPNHRLSKDGLRNKCRYCVNTAVSKSRKKLRNLILQQYGGKCSCCGESHTEFLALDHIYGGGTQERSKMGDQFTFYRYIRDCGFPKDLYRLLCHNCNQSIGVYGYCPHQL